MVAWPCLRGETTTPTAHALPCLSQGGYKLGPCRLQRHTHINFAALHRAMGGAGPRAQAALHLTGHEADQALVDPPTEFLWLLLARGGDDWNRRA